MANKCPHCSIVMTENERNGHACPVCRKAFADGSIAEVQAAPTEDKIWDAAAPGLPQHASDIVVTTTNKSTDTCLVWFPTERLISGDLPEVCICCGEPSTRVSWQRFGVLSRAGLGPLVSARMNKKGPIPVCNKHRNHWRNLNALFSLVMISGFLIWMTISMTAVSFLPEDKDLKVLVGLGGMISGLVAFVLWIGFGASYLRCRKVGAGSVLQHHMLLENVSTEFVQAC